MHLLELETVRIIEVLDRRGADNRGASVVEENTSALCVCLQCTMYQLVLGLHNGLDNAKQSPFMFGWDSVVSRPSKLFFNMIFLMYQWEGLETRL